MKVCGGVLPAVGALAAVAHSEMAALNELVEVADGSEHSVGE